MANVLVVFSSIFGANADLAQQAETALIRAGATTRVRGVPQNVLAAHEVPSAKAHPKADEADLEWADGYVFLSPVHTANLSAAMKAFVDNHHEGALAGKFANKTFTAMATAELPHSGQEVVVNTLNSIGSAWGCVIVAPSTANSTLNSEDGDAFGLSFTLEKGKLPEDIAPALDAHLGRFVGLTQKLTAEAQAATEAATIEAETDSPQAPRHTIDTAFNSRRDT